ncbi:MAG: phosphodiester glycosidase family protein [Roseovarius sp.]|nr:phosphodiester glycosidase family protein [Roseovarius sp.]
MSALRGIWLALVLAAGPLAAADCRDLIFDGAGYAICEVDMTTEDLRLFLNDGAGVPLSSFGNVDAQLESEGLRLGFAMNAGMYHPDRSPVGYYAEGGEARSKVITSAGPGNFGLLPNGVFCIGDGRAEVIETLRFTRDAPDCNYASQSGPMLVIDGELHPRFLAKSDSLYIRNGVGTSADGKRAVFAISQSPVNFHAFARLFRDHLGLPQALYFDGNISRLHAPDLGRIDAGFPMGPIVGTVVPR